MLIVQISLCSKCGRIMFRDSKNSICICTCGHTEPVLPFPDNMIEDMYHNIDTDKSATYYEDMEKEDLVEECYSLEDELDEKIGIIAKLNYMCNNLISKLLELGKYLEEGL